MKKKLINNIFVCATEQSGENIGVQIINQLKLKNNYTFEGVGGDKIAPLLNNQYYS